MQKSPLPLLALALVVLNGATLPALEQPHGRYPDLYGNTTIPEDITIKGTEAPELYRTLADRPQAYSIAVQPGQYQVTLHYLTAGEQNDGAFTVSLDGRPVQDSTPCLTSTRKLEGKEISAAQVTFPVQANGEVLELRINRPEWLLRYAIAALEVVDSGGNAVRINCGSNTAFTDDQGQTWDGENRLPFPDVTITTSAGDAKGEWIDIGTEILEKLEAAGVYPMPKYDGRYTRRLNSVIVDHHAGKTYLALAGIGLWHYNGPGGEVSRADEESYTGTPLDYQTNPYGSGFYAFSSHGFSGDTYQLYSLDGTPATFESFPGNNDYGAVDWSKDPPRTVLAIHHHRQKMELSQDGGKTFQTIMEPGRQLAQVGVYPGPILIHCMQGDRDGNPLDNTGVYTSTDLGQSWQKVSDVMTPHSCFDIPIYKNRAYIYTTEGLLKSDDFGTSWNLVPDSPVFEHQVIFGKDDSRMLGFNSQGGYLSTDQGVTWKQILPPPPQEDKMKWIQDHKYYDFAWDTANNAVYAYAPDKVYRIVPE